MPDATPLLSSPVCCWAQNAVAKAEAEVKRVQVEMEKALARVESRLQEKEVECESVTMQLYKAEKEMEELRRM